MKLLINIDKSLDEECIEVKIKELNKETNQLISEIENFMKAKRFIISANKGVKSLLELNNIQAFIVREKNVYAQMGNLDYRVKEKFKDIENKYLGQVFFKVSKSAIININYVESFESGFGRGYIAIMKETFTRHQVAPNYFKQIKKYIEGDENE
jgi:DNA-binding LytR/AlgR family response regulator